MNRTPRYVDGRPARRRRNKTPQPEPVVVQSTNRAATLRVLAILVFLVPLATAGILASRGITPDSILGQATSVRPVNSANSAIPNEPTATNTPRSLAPQYSIVAEPGEATRSSLPFMSSTAGGWLLECQEGQRLVFDQESDGLGSATCEEVSSSSLVVVIPSETATPTGEECCCD